MNKNSVITDFCEWVHNLQNYSQKWQDKTQKFSFV